MAGAVKDGPFKTLHHICIIVRDIEKAVKYYESIGIGPWVDYPPLGEFKELKMPDADGFRAITFKYVQLGPVQIQLGQPGKGDTPQGRFLKEHGEGVFHVGFVMDDVDAGEAKAKAVGLEPFMRGRRDDGSGFTYFDTARHAGGVNLSIRKSPPAKK
jgi:catechol 2,3-dioxygenase-like lactoylglutathione lyase family enzyme